MCLIRRKTGWRIILYRTQRVWDMVGGGKQIASGEAAGTMTWECWMPGQKVSILGCKILFFFPYPHSSHIVLNIEFLSKGLNTLPQTPGIGHMDCGQRGKRLARSLCEWSHDVWVLFRRNGILISGPLGHIIGEQTPGKKNLIYLIKSKRESPGQDTHWCEGHGD